MDDFKIECYITSDENENTKLSEMPEKDYKLWQKDIEIRALSEYCKRKIKAISNKN